MTSINSALKLFVVFELTFCFFGSGRAAADPPHYHVADLGTLGGTSSIGTAINNAGQVTGWSNTTDNSANHAFLYSDGTMRDLGTLGGGSDSIGFALNLSGQVTGYAWLPGGDYHAFLYSSGMMMDLGTLPGDTISAGFGINESGEVVGSSDGVVSHAVLYSNGSWHDLGSLGGSYNNVASAINDSGLITGSSTVSPGGSVGHACIFHLGDPPIDLGTLGAYSSWGAAINDLGQIAGTSNVPGLPPVPTHAFLYSGAPGAPISDLGTLGGMGSAAVGINNSGQIIGSSLTGGGFPQSHVFLYADGSMVDIQDRFDGNTPSFDVRGINDAGQITGVSIGSHAYVATPFYRQGDPPPDVPTTFGDGDLTKNTGCALTSIANMCGSLIALAPNALPIPITTPAKVNDALVAGRVFNGSSAILNWNLIGPAISAFATIKMTSAIEVTPDNVDEVLTDRIYNRGERVVLRFQNTIPGVSSGPHFVWVIGKENGDWKIADPGWNSGPEPDISSLQAHMDGFPINGKFHQFTPNLVRTFANVSYGNNGQGPVNQRRSSGAPSENVSSSVAIDATGPVDLLVTDPMGRRLGYDQESGQNYSEIPDGSYVIDTPIMWPDGDGFQGGDPSGIKQSSIPSPVVGTYTVQATGTANGTSVLNLRIIGAGGASQATTYSVQTEPGVPVIKQIEYSDAGSADLSVAQTNSPSQPLIGQTLSYQVVVQNHGPTSSGSSALTDLLPPNVEFISAESPIGTCTQSGSSVSCSLAALAPQATATITIVVRPTSAGPITNSAYIAGFETDPDDANNHSDLSLSVPNLFTLSSSLSRKTHGGAGSFDVVLPTSGATGIEPRTGGTGLNHTLVFTFDNNVASGTAAISRGVGTVIGTNFGGNTMTVSLGNVANNQTLSLSLTGVKDEFGQSLPKTSLKATFLLGDVNADKKVSNKDVTAAKGQKGMPLTDSNFRDDVTLDGIIDNADVSLIRSQIGH